MGAMKQMFRAGGNGQVPTQAGRNIRTLPVHIPKQLVRYHHPSLPTEGTVSPST